MTEKKISTQTEFKSKKLYHVGFKEVKEGRTEKSCTILMSKNEETAKKEVLDKHTKELRSCHSYKLFNLSDYLDMNGYTLILKK